MVQIRIGYLVPLARPTLINSWRFLKGNCIMNSVRTTMPVMACTKCWPALYYKQEIVYSARSITSFSGPFIKKRRSYSQCATNKPKPSYYSEEIKWTKVLSTNKEKLDYLLRLSKARLTGLVVLTTLAGYVVAPGAIHLLPFCLTILGTTMCSASANSFNQFLEIPYDSQMSRTRNRVLVQGLVRPLDAFLFGSLTALGGITLLYTGVNGITAALGALNIFLYAAVYTPFKRLTILNTWIGSIVGAIPPVMGWCASTGSLDTGALAFALVLYCWQFPHFNSLSWSYRPDYSRAGYRMMAVTDPALCRRVTFRYSLAQFPLALMFPLCDVTNEWFVLESLPLNIYLTYLAFRFYRFSDNQSARKLFKFSLLHLPALMLLIFINLKKEQKVDQQTLPIGEGAGIAIKSCNTM